MLSLRSAHTLYEDAVVYSSVREEAQEAMADSQPSHGNGTAEYARVSTSPPSTVWQGRSDDAAIGEQEPLDDLCFASGSFLRIQGALGTSSDFTLDAYLRLTEINLCQLVFSQTLTRHPFHAPNVLLLARVLDGKLQFGCISVAAGKERFTTGLEMCVVPLFPEDADNFVRFTFVQSENSICVYKNGLLEDSCKRKKGVDASPLCNTLLIGGSPMDTTASLKGCMRGFRVFNAALSSEVVAELSSQKAASTATAAGRHLVVHIVMARPPAVGFVNGTPQEALCKLSITAAGDVSAWPSPGARAGDAALGTTQCVPELDFGYDDEETEMFTLHGTAFVHHATKNYVMQWREMRELTPEALQAAHHVCCRQMAHYGCLRVLAQLLIDTVGAPERGAPFTSTEDRLLLRGLTRQCVSGVAFSGAISLHSKLKTAVLHGVCRRDVGGVNLLTGDVVLRTLLDVGCIGVKLLEFESSHPLKPSSKCVHEVSVPDEELYCIILIRGVGRAASRFRLRWTLPCPTWWHGLLGSP
ncbi:hypothetical protein STCU_10146 [Strigomonas culicis]|uniref:Uncharacterized protein n=1 Tax=Strigomonas culicis TaxID=28005 RepID=S9TN60_9TRYP|nr:hypothetical protein STCU_10146 [Strigomonas culicis]|eukprot:EPY18164.1 hypothetical protein STCU_10146 [Strigomonas culicis]